MGTEPEPTARPVAGPAVCPACAAVAAARSRHWFWAFQEKFGEPAFRRRLRDGGGYCARHARDLLARVDGARAGPAYRAVLAGWHDRLERDGPWRPACPACGDEAQAARHVLSALRRGRLDEVLLPIDPDAPLCIPHLRRLLADPPPEARRAAAYRERTLAAVATGDLAALRFAAGPDAGAPFRGDAAEPSGGGGPFVGPARVDDDLLADRCPVCAAGRRAASGVLSWLAEDRSAEDLDELGRLCPAHLWDAVVAAPHLAAPLLTRSRAHLREWLAATDRAPPLRRRLGPRRARRPRERPCAACAAAATARRRTLALLGPALAEEERRARYRRHAGLCLPHAHADLPAATRALVRRRGAVRAALLVWELDEAARKTAWSVRYEPPGPERHAWRRAIAAAAGEATIRDGRTPLPPAASSPAV